MYEAFVNPFRCRTPASFQIAVLLDDDRSAGKTIGQRGDILGELIGVGERFGKLVGDKEGEVRVLATELRVRIGVAVGQDDAVVILDDDVTARIGAESPDNGPLACRVEEFAFVEITVDILHDDIRGLDTDADVHPIVHEIDSIFLQRIHQEGGAFSADGHDKIMAGDFPSVFKDDTFRTSVFDENVLDLGAEEEVDAAGKKMIVNIGKNHEILIRSQVADFGAKKEEAVAYRLLFNFSDFFRVGIGYVGSRTKFDVYFVAFLNQGKKLFIGNIIRKPSSELGSDIEFPVRESSRSAKAASHRAGRQAGLSQQFVFRTTRNLVLEHRAVAFGYFVPPVDDQDLFARIFLC